MEWPSLSTQKISKVYYQFLSKRCYFCQIKSKQLICENCLHGFEFNITYCQTCKLPTDTNIESCAKCKQNPPHYQQLISPLIYTELSQSLIKSLKFHRQFHASHPLCFLLSQSLNQHYQTHAWPKALIPVPSHHKRIRERGFCHMTLLSKCLLNYLDTSIPLISKGLLKQHHRQAQHTLDKEHREKLKADTFHCPSPIPDHIALFDDVVTTGSTVEACVKQLTSAGAKQIDVWSVARA